jgi:hypothetical protein
MDWRSLNRFIFPDGEIHVGHDHENIARQIIEQRRDLDVFQLSPLSATEYVELHYRAIRISQLQHYPDTLISQFDRKPTKKQLEAIEDILPHCKGDYIALFLKTWSDQ